ncbi:hypothetical protein [Achromobacter spanius]|uniref:hypothetical protein n=1 Tax=Achromobacter spanius TaxID=217203 RepID=UPI0037FC18C3
MIVPLLVMLTCGPLKLAERRLLTNTTGISSLIAFGVDTRGMASIVPALVMFTYPLAPLSTSSAGPILSGVHVANRPSLVPRSVPMLVTLIGLSFALPIFTPDINIVAVPNVEGATSPMFSNVTLSPLKFTIALSNGMKLGTTLAPLSTLIPRLLTLVMNPCVFPLHSAIVPATKGPHAA